MQISFIEQQVALPEAKAVVTPLRLQSIHQPGCEPDVSWKHWHCCPQGRGSSPPKDSTAAASIFPQISSFRCFTVKLLNKIFKGKIPYNNNGKLSMITLIITCHYI